MNKQEQWREEFEKDILIRYPHSIKEWFKRSSTDGYYNNDIHQQWMGYLAACKKRDEEIEKLKAEMKDDLNEIENSITFAHAELLDEKDKEIAQLKAENEEWKQEAHKRLNEMINDHWFKKYKELKEQLKLERECVDFYANTSNWSTLFGWLNGNARLIINDTEHTCAEDVFNGTGIGGKRARSVQAQRKVDV